MQKKKERYFYMKKTIKIAILVAILLISVGVLAGCGNQEASANTIVGVWAYEGDSFVYTFNEDGTGSYDALGSKLEFTYTTDGDKLSIQYPDTDFPFETTYSIEGKILNIKDSFDNDTLYERKLDK